MQMAVRVCLRSIGWPACVLAGVLACAPLAGGQETSLLQQLDRETQALYQQVQRSVVRVQLPPPAWLDELLADEHPARRWQQLDPEVRKRIETAPPSGRLGTVIVPATQPSADGKQPGDDAQDGATWQVRPLPGPSGVQIESRRQKGDTQVIVVTPQIDGESQLGLRVQPGQAGFAPANLAIVLDEAGHLLVPVYLQQRQFDGPVHVELGDGRTARATFVGSDRQTGLTVLKLDQPAGAPVRISDQPRPAEGSLVMILSPANDAARLAVWTGASREWGMVIAADGAVVGFARHGQFLSASLSMPAIRALIGSGQVDRPRFGMVVVEIREGDALRQKHALGRRPAMHVMRVIPGSAAERAGLRSGDIVLELNDQPVGDVPTFAAILAAHDGPATLTILRDGRQERFEVRFDQ